MERIERVVLNNMRYYKVTEYVNETYKEGTVLGLFPSVTTVLGQTANKFGIKKWEEKIGKEAAARITQNAGKRGTVMHRLCEIYLGLPHELPAAERLEETLRISVQDKEINQFDNRSKIVGGMLFYNYIRANTFSIIKQTKLTEQFLWTTRDGGYAGTVDNVSTLVDETDSVIDFKTALRPKNEKYIEDYKCQVAAYAVAVFDRTGIRVRSANIMISNETTPEPQVFKMEQKELKIYYQKFTARLKEFNEKYPAIEPELLNEAGKDPMDLF